MTENQKQTHVYSTLAAKGWIKTTQDKIHDYISNHIVSLLEMVQSKENKKFL